ncbi:MAG: DUF2786 domain-containing protein [Methylomarinum sp.]|nr:DUF2786 domain-containing protein [Methylomarinum sp.]
MSKDNKIIEKIKKCLALSKSSNAHEAANALRQAQNMMEKHRISDLDVEVANATEKNTKASAQQKPSQWEASLASMVGGAFSCKTIFARGIFNNAQWRFIGTGTTPELATYAFDVLLRQLKKDRRHYIKSKLGRCKPRNKTARADTYCEAWVCEVYETIQHFAPNKAQEKAINAYMEKRYSAAKDLTPRTRKSKGCNADSQWKDQVAGSTDGANAQLNRGVKENQSNRLGAS